LLQSVDTQLKQGRTQIVILISSPGGDVLSGFTPYKYLKGIQAEVTTINIGSVDSAATIIFCAGKKRYSVPEQSKSTISHPLFQLGLASDAKP